jgi:hypothetical protein
MRESITIVMARIEQKVRLTAWKEVEEVSFYYYSNVLLSDAPRGLSCAARCPAFGPSFRC